MTTANQPLREAMKLVYSTRPTNVGHDMFVCILYVQEDHSGSENWTVRSKSAPFILAQQYGTRRIVPGSVGELLRNAQLLCQDFLSDQRKHLELLERSHGEELAREYYEYRRKYANSLILLASVVRNLFHVFSKLSAQLKVQMYDYEGNKTHQVSMKDLMDLLVHCRYMNFEGEFVTDLISAQSSNAMQSTSDFMGHRFRTVDFLEQILEAIKGITIKDLVTRLRGCFKSLSFETPTEEVIFLFQNMESLSDFLEGVILSEEYHHFVERLFPKSDIPEIVAAKTKGKSFEVRIRFPKPHIKFGDFLDDKKVIMRVKALMAYYVNGECIHQCNETRETEILYEEFFDRIVKSFGQERLLDFLKKFDESIGFEDY
ncbi:MAG: hypothetical protein OXO49_09065 [Gammaproteobacteria bacterium]|nr:hypothetical protein [Gammaproteobacteria bacterium]MDE0252730.1 hypothetical protein [Gammaproteobacteria bacterium]MDE0402255.1 hypothetical protein [Gammaproteobacteria bacterium]